MIVEFDTIEVVKQLSKKLEDLTREKSIFCIVKEYITP